MYAASSGDAIGPPWQSTITSSRTDFAASAQLRTSGTQSASVRAVFAPIVPPVVRPRCATTMSAPASVIAIASASLNTYGVVSRPLRCASRIMSTSSA